MRSPIITIELTEDQALVLFEYFARFADSDEWQLRSNAEYLAFSKIAAALESTLAAPFQANYADQLSAAQQRLSAGYQGLAPGVKP